MFPLYGCKDGRLLHTDATFSGEIILSGKGHIYKIHGSIKYTLVIMRPLKTELQLFILTPSQGTRCNSDVRMLRKRT